MKRKPCCKISCRLIVSLSWLAELQLHWQPQVLRSFPAGRTTLIFWCNAIEKHSLTVTRQWQVGMGKGPRTPLAGHPRLPGRHEECRLCWIPSAQEAKHLVKKPIGTSYSRNMLASLDQTVVGDEDVRERPGGETWGGSGADGPPSACPKTLSSISAMGYPVPALTWPAAAPPTSPWHSGYAPTYTAWKTPISHRKDQAGMKRQK